MTTGVNLIPRNRLALIPENLRLAHEYCFFIHDECTRILLEYEGAKAYAVSIKFRTERDAKIFSTKTAKRNPISTMRSLGYEIEARQVILNQITMAMVSDCLHHIFEALKCLEKRKVVVAFNLLRKPLTDNLLYLSWMLGDEDAFYLAFTKNSPRGITSSKLKSKRSEIISNALAVTQISHILDSIFIDKVLFDKSNDMGFQKLFQHAVHLVTVQEVNLETAPENFNFIFYGNDHDDLYLATYHVLPNALLYLSHVIFKLFERIAAPDEGSKIAFNVRSILGFYLLQGGDLKSYAVQSLSALKIIECPDCQSPLKMTAHNAARMILTESFRCVKCRRRQPFPFSWIF